MIETPPKPHHTAEIARTSMARALSSPDARARPSLRDAARRLPKYPGNFLMNVAIGTMALGADQAAFGSLSPASVTKYA